MLEFYTCYIKWQRAHIYIACVRMKKEDSKSVCSEEFLVCLKQNVSLFFYVFNFSFFLNGSIYF